ncbi:MAG: tyrosine-protein phosphatase [Phycisphaeraceae bacterium]|nr:tyrosine-protein phosphatase [Phycisphaeraceae bacterium]
MERVAAARRILWVAAVASLCAAGGLYYRYVIRDQIVPRRFAEVEPGKVYRAGRLSPTQLQAKVREHGIRTIVDLGAFEPGSPEARTAERTALALGVDRFVFGLQGDGTGAPQDYVEALRIALDPARQPVLVHCAAGTHRTSVCITLVRNASAGGTLTPDFRRDFEAFNYDRGETPQTAAYLLEWGQKILDAYRTGASLGPTTLDASGARAAVPKPGAAPEVGPKDGPEVRP